MKRLAVLFLFSSLLTANSMTLQEALEKTYVYNPELKSAQQSLMQADEQVMQALSGFMPNAQLNKSKTMYDTKNQPVSGINPITDYHSDKNGTNLSVKQNLFRGFGDVSRVSAAKKAVAAARSKFAAAEQKILTQAVEAYLNVVKAHDAYNIYMKKMKSYRTLVASMKQKFEAGQATKTDVSQAESRYSQSISNSISAKGQLTAAKAKFKAITGEEATNLKMPHLKLKVPAKLDDAVSIARNKNPQLAEARYGRDAKKANVNVARSALMPNADLEFARSASKSAVSKGSHVKTLGNTTKFTVTIPLFSGGKNWSGLRSSKRDAKSSEYIYKNAVNTVYDQTVAAWQNFEISKASMHARNDAVEFAKVAWDGMQIEEKAGTRDTTDVIIAQNNYFDSLVELLNEKVNYRMRYYSLKSVLGEMSAKDLGLNVKRFDPRKNYNKITKEIIGSF